VRSGRSRDVARDGDDPDEFDVGADGGDGTYDDMVHRAERLLLHDPDQHRNRRAWKGAGRMRRQQSREATVRERAKPRY